MMNTSYAKPVFCTGYNPLSVSASSWQIPMSHVILCSSICRQSYEHSVIHVEMESGTFVEDDLRQYASDILWSIKITTGDDGYIHLLLEHQSSADKNMAFHQLRYIVVAMKCHLEAGHKNLLLVMPVPFYHGSQSL